MTAGNHTFVEGVMDYRLELKVKNNWLVRKMVEHGIDSAADLSRESNCTASDVGKLMNLKEPPFNKNGELRAYVARICERLSCEVEDIVPPQHMASPLEQNVFVAEVSCQQMAALAAPDLDETVFQGQLSAGMHAALNMLTARERLVLTMRLGIDGGEEKTLEDVGRVLDVNRERVRQIEAKALRKLRSPTTPAGSIIDRCFGSYDARD